MRQNFRVRAAKLVRMRSKTYYHRRHNISGSLTHIHRKASPPLHQNKWKQKRGYSFMSHQKRLGTIIISAQTDWYVCSNRLACLFKPTGISAHLAAGLHGVLYGSDRNRTVVVLGREYHALAHKSVLELAWCEVGYEQNLLAHERLWFIPLCDARDDGAT